MKHFCLFIVLTLAFSSYAQVGIGTATPSDAAMLDVSATTAAGNFRGLKPPVMTIAERDMIPVVAADVGMLVFVDDIPNGVQCLQFWDGATWRCLGGTGGVRTVVGQQDFEAAPAAPVVPFTESGTGTTQTGTGGTPVSNLFVSGSQGYGVNAGTSTITFDPIDFTSFSSGSIEFRVAAFSTTTATAGGADNNDTVIAAISTDGGTTFSDEFLLEGTGNATFDFTGTGFVEATTDNDNNPTIHDLITGGGTLTGVNGLSTCRIENIPNVNNLVLRITLSNAQARELWVIDDVVFYGE